MLFHFATPYKCVYCRFTLLNERELDEHLLKNHFAPMLEKGVFYCGKCHECSPTLPQLIKHVYGQHYETPDLIMCEAEGCNKCFREQVQFNNHKKNHHAANMIQLQPPPLGQPPSPEVVPYSPLRDIPMPPQPLMNYSIPVQPMMNAYLPPILPASVFQQTSKVTSSPVIHQSPSPRARPLPSIMSFSTHPSSTSYLQLGNGGRSTLSSMSYGGHSSATSFPQFLYPLSSNNNEVAPGFTTSAPPSVHPVSVPHMLTYIDDDDQFAVELPPIVYLLDD